MGPRLKDKVCLITGAASGIGEACARLFAEEGARVVLSDLNDDAGQALADELGGATTYLHHDVTSPEEWQAVMDTIAKRFGKLQVLVNSAGIAGGGGIEVETYDDWQRIMRVNGDSIFLGCKAALELMKTSGGSIINISSIHGIKAQGYVAAYSASKGAVKLLSKSIAKHCADMGYGIRVNSVHPGYIDTPMLQVSMLEGPDGNALRDMIIGQHALKRMGTAKEVAYGILYLASDESSFTTGSELVIDGGYLL